MRIVLTLLGAALLSTSALAAGYNERRLGDLSDDGLAPTLVKLNLGNNVIAGKYGAKNTPDGKVTDRDYFKIKILEGQQLSAIVLEPETDIGGNVSFIGVQRGKQVTVPPVGGSAEDLLGWAHYATSDVGTNLLPEICNGAGAQGCTPPLGPGIYSFWVQELAVCKCRFRFTFTVTAAAQ